MLRAALAQAVVEAAAEMRGGVWASVDRDDVARLADAAAERCAVVLLGPSPAPKRVLPPIEAPQGGAGRPSGSPGQADEGDVLPGATGAPPPAAQRPVGAEAPGERDAGPSGAPRDTRAFSGAHLVPRGPRRSSILHVEPPTEDVGAADSASGQWVVEAPSASAEEREAMVQELLRLWGASWLRFLWKGRRTRAVGHLFLGIVALGAVASVFFPIWPITPLYRLFFAFTTVCVVLGWRWAISATFELAPLLWSLSRVPDDRQRVVGKRGKLLLFALGLFIVVGLAMRLSWYGNADDYLAVVSFLLLTSPYYALLTFTLLCIVGVLSEVGEVVGHLQGKLDGESGALDIETVRSRVASHAALVKRVGEAFGPAVDVLALILAAAALVYLVGAILGIQWASGTPELIGVYMFYLLIAISGFLLTKALSSASLALRRTLQRINDLALQEDGPASLEATTEHMRLVQRLQTMREFFGFRVFGMLVTPELITQVGSALASVFLFGLARLFF